MSFGALVVLLFAFAILATVLPEVVVRWLTRRRGRKGK